MSGSIRHKTHRGSTKLAPPVTGQRLRIYLVIGTFLPHLGGAERQALLQARRLRARGHDVCVVTLRHKRAWASREVIDGVPVLRVNGGVLADRDQFPALARKAAYALGLSSSGVVLWRRRNDYDVIQLHQLNLLALPIGILSRLAFKPLVITVGGAGVRGAPASESRGTPGAVTRASVVAPPRAPAAGSLPAGDLAALQRLGSPFVRLMNWLLTRRGIAVVVLSEGMRRYLAEHRFTGPATYRIANGVDIRHFTPLRDVTTGASSSIVTRTSGPTVVCVARLAPVKGVDVLIRAWQLVHAQAANARLCIVGTGPQEVELHTLATGMHLEESLNFAGAQTDVRTFYQHADLAVLPSRSEGMPNALLEAMACGLPCVATRVSGSEDLIEDGVNGLLVEPEDVEALAQALLRLLGDPVLRTRLGAEARVTVETGYSIEQILDEYEKLYAELIAQMGKPGSAPPHCADARSERT